MGHFNTIMSQLLVHVPRHDFQNLVSRWGGDRYVKRFTTWNQLVSLFYAQAGDKQSLRDIQSGLIAQSPKLYHLGLTGAVAKSTLSDANAARDWRIYQGLFNILLQRCRSLSPRHKFKFKNPLKTMDSTVIELCLSMFPWAKFRTTKGLLNFIASWTTPEIFLPLPSSRMGSVMMSGPPKPSLTRFRTASTAWTKGMSTFHSSVGYTMPKPSSSPAPKTT